MLRGQKSEHPLLCPRVALTLRRRASSGRVAQAFDLAGAKNIVGAPSFAHFAKGGNLERMRDRVAERQKLCRQHRYPPLQKTQGRGTLSIDGAHRHHQRVGHPPAACAERSKNGAWWALQDLNLGPMDYESTALTAELRAR